MSLKLITAPLVYPITEAQVQEHLKLSDDECCCLSDTMARLISDATAYAEDTTWRALLTQTWDYYLDAWPSERHIQIPKPPLQSITGVYYTPDGELEQEFTDFTVDTVAEPGKIVLNRDESWPTDTLEPVNGIRVRFVAGYGDDAEDVPTRIIQAILLHTEQSYDGTKLSNVIDGILLSYSMRRL
jgi:uncharacterized phiE125 gp8 family phage protein